MFTFEKRQNLKFVVADANSELGDFETPMLMLLASEHKMITRSLKDKEGSQTGVLSVSYEETKVAAEFEGKECEKMVRFNYYWNNLNNMNNGFFGLGKYRAKVRFEVAKYDPVTKSFKRLRSTPFVQNEKKNSTYKIPTQLFSLS